MTRPLLLAIVYLSLVVTPAFGGPLEATPTTRSKVSLMPANTEAPSKDKRETPLAEGETVYRRVCFRCHDEGISGAPKLGDQEAWKVRIPAGIDIMVRNAIEGFQGNQGVHPPRGGDRHLSDAEIAAAVYYIVEMCKEGSERK